MDAAARTYFLAKDLSEALAMASRCVEPRSPTSQGYRLRAAGFLTENDRVAHAIDTELGELFRSDPALSALVEATSSRGSRKRLTSTCIERCTSTRTRESPCSRRPEVSPTPSRGARPSVVRRRGAGRGGGSAARSSSWG
jgi:hypothetical protein